MSKKKSNSAKPQGRARGGKSKQTPPPRKKAVALNWRGLLWTLVGILAVGGGAWGWHAWQVKDFAGNAFEQGRELETKANQSDTEAKQLLSEATELQTGGQTDEARELFQKAQDLASKSFEDRRAAMQYFLHYTQLEPDDPEGLLALARLSERSGNSPSAVEWYANAIRAAENQPGTWSNEIAARTAYAKLLLAMASYYQQAANRSGRPELHDDAAARFRQAQEESEELLRNQSAAAEDQATATRILGLSLFGLHELQALTLESLASLPEQFQSFDKGLKQLLQEHSTPANVADSRVVGPFVYGILKAGFQQNPDDAELARALAQIYREYPELLGDAQLAKFGSDEDARKQALNALADEVMDRLVEAAEENLGRADDSDEALVRAADAHVSRYVYRSAYELADAKVDLERALELSSEFAKTDAAARVQLLAGRSAFREAAATEPTSAGGIVARKAKLEEAEAHFAEAANLQYANPDAYLGLADARRSLGRVDEAIDALKLGLQNAGQENWDLNIALVNLLIDTNNLEEEEAEERFIALSNHLAAQRAYLSESVRRSFEARRDLLRSRWFVQQKRYEEAAKLLESILTEHSFGSTASGSNQKLNRDGIRARLLLALSYERLARQKLADGVSREKANLIFRKAAETYGELARDLPQLSQFREAAAKACLAAGDPDAAVPQLQAALRQQDSLVNRILLARARLEQAKNSPSSVQLRDAAKNELDRLEKRLEFEPVAQPWALDLMRAELLALDKPADSPKARSDELLPVFRRLEEDYPLSSQLRDLLIVQYRDLKAEDDMARATISQEIAKAFSEGRAAEAVVLERKLEQFVDPDSVLLRFYRANRLLLEPASQPKVRSQRVQEAEKLADGILRDRPDWPQAHLLDASVKRAQGNLVDAVAGIQKAYELDPRHLRTLEQLIRMQLEIGQTEEARSRITEARAKFPTSDGLVQLETLVQRKAGDHDAAIQSAREEVARRPSDAASRMRLGALLQEAGQTDEAEKVFREALLIAPDDPRPMTALFALYGRTDRKDEAAKMLDELGAKEQLKPWQRELIYARGYEALEQPEKAQSYYTRAEEAYRTAIAETPDDTALHLGLVELLLWGDDPARFEPALAETQKILESDPESADARRMRAGILWLRNGGDDRQQALAIYDTLTADPEQATATDRYRRAQMLESLGQFSDAGEAFDQVIESATLNADTLAAQVGRSIRTGQLAKAETQLQRLEQMAPGSIRTIALRVQLLHSQGHDDQIESILTQFQKILESRAGEDTEKQAQAAQLIGDLYRAVEMPEKAEPHYRRLNELKPEALSRLAVSLASQGRTKEAVDMLVSAKEDVDELVKVNAICQIFVASTPGDDEWKTAEPVLAAATEKYAEKAGLLTAISSVYIVRNDIAKAISLLEQSAKLQPENVIILNNLASLLGEQPGRAEDALKYITQAIQHSTHAPGLLDTKGTILLHLNRDQEAAEVLQQAAQGDVRDPRYTLHLAVATDRVGNADEAKQMLQQAMQNGLLTRPEFILTPVDKKWLSQLREKFSL